MCRAAELVTAADDELTLGLLGSALELLGSGLADCIRDVCCREQACWRMIGLTPGCCCCLPDCWLTASSWRAELSTNPTTPCRPTFDCTTEGLVSAADAALEFSDTAGSWSGAEGLLWLFPVPGSSWDLIRADTISSLECELMWFCKFSASWPHTGQERDILIN